MLEDEKIAFLSEKVKELEKITEEIEQVFPEKSFKIRWNSDWEYRGSYGFSCIWNKVI